MTEPKCAKDHSHDPEDWDCQAFMPGECASCSWPTTKLTQYGMWTVDRQQIYKWLCEICSSTTAGSAYEYPRQYPNGDVLRFLAWQTNYLAALIKGEEVTKLTGD